MPIRHGEPSDFPALEMIERETALMFSPTDLPAELAQPLPTALLTAGVSASLLWVADEPPCGLLGFILCECHDRSLHVREMDVRPRFGRKGIGARLLMHACASAGGLHLRYVTLTTFSHLPWNAPFYARHGFRITEDFTLFPHLGAALRHECDMGLNNRIAMARNAA